MKGVLRRKYRAVIIWRRFGHNGCVDRREVVEPGLSIMKKLPSNRLLKVPVRYIDDRWECEYGGVVPVARGTEAELLIAGKSIIDKNFLARLKLKSVIKVLNEGSILLACLATKDQLQLTDDQKKLLIPLENATHVVATDYVENWSSGSPKPR